MFPWMFPALAPRELTQAINPWTWWLDASDNVVSLINITHKSGNPEMEKSIVQDVAGYGMQLGKIEAALNVVLSTLSEKELTSEQKKALAEYREMIAEIEQAKEASILEQMSAGGIEQLIKNLTLLKEKYPKRYAAVTKRLQETISQ